MVLQDLKVRRVFKESEVYQDLWDLLDHPIQNQQNTIFKMIYKKTNPQFQQLFRQKGIWKNRFKIIYNGTMLDLED